MIVVDLGCARYGGDFSLERLIHQFSPDTLYGFDPNAELVASAPENATRMDETHWVLPDGTELVLEQKAAWLYDGEIGYRSEALNSWITEMVDAPQIECFDLAKFIVALADGDHKDIVLKMDVEGAEYDLLEHLIAARADALLKLAWIEWHPKRIPNGAQRRRTIEDRIACEITEWRW